MSLKDSKNLKALHIFTKTYINELCNDNMSKL